MGFHQNCQLRLKNIFIGYIKVTNCIEEIHLLNFHFRLLFYLSFKEMLLIAELNHNKKFLNINLFNSQCNIF